MERDIKRRENETELSYDGLADVTYDLSFSKLSADHQ